MTNQVDNLLEKVSDNIDIILGKKKDKKDSEIEEELKTLKKDKNIFNNLNSKNKVRVEISDDYDIDNSYFPFIPKIKFKPYALKELSYKLIDAKKLRAENPKTKTISFDDRKMSVDTNLFSHPYKVEIETLITHIHDEKLEKFHNFSSRNLNKLTFQRVSMQEFIYSGQNLNSTFNSYDVPNFSSKIYKLHDYLFNHFNYILGSDMKQIKEEISCSYLTEDLLTLYEVEYLPIEQSKLVYVECLEGLQSMINDILTYSKEIAVDLEHHSYESYLGFTCLMQISTRFCDYILDTIKLRPHIHYLNEIFCNPTILKVFHGADFDVEWLQKDFGVYLVNMFDTGQAARILRFPSFSLASLLSSICNITADKKYQTADWRLRPLPYEMVKYAREDTHYLLFIYDNLKKQLVQKALLNNDDPLNAWFATLKKSNELALKQYVKPFVKNFEYYNMITRNQPHMSKIQLSVLKLIYKFRDYVARKLDLSPDCVLSRKNIFLLAKLTKYDAENFFMNLDKNTHIRNFIPDLLKIIELKLIKNSEKIEKEGGQNFLKQSYETSYLENMKNKLNDTKSKVKTLCEVSVNGKFFSHVNLKILAGEVQMKEKNQSKLFINEQNQQAKTTKMDYENLLLKFERFSLIPYLKEKYPDLKVEVKQIKKNEEIIKPEIQHKFLNTKRNPEIPLDMLDLTNYKKPQLEMKYGENEEEDENEIYHKDYYIKEEVSKCKNENHLKNMRESENFMKSKFFFNIRFVEYEELIQ